MNWYGVFKSRLNVRDNLLPWQIWEFTEPEILLLLEDADKRTPSGAENLADDDAVIAEAIRWERMTWLERLQNYEW